MTLLKKKKGRGGRREGRRERERETERGGERGREVQNYTVDNYIDDQKKKSYRRELSSLKLFTTSMS